uniref:NADH-ubiquinone oxidoreductase chain 2 n=1 Tax=Tigrigobius macrodon TaxID=317248 RepID=Q94W72_9GOBI|nr:NADH dehydrogenase subunit 2 [Tigrigobius macrodon]
MNPYILFLLLFSLGLGTTLTFATSHWLLAWMGLEINTLAILPLMIHHHHPRAVEATTKYFLTQAVAAASLLFAATTNAWLTGQWNIYSLTHPVPVLIMTFALSLKIGLAPMHAWLPEVLQGLDFTTGLVLSTWQKLAPFAILIQLPLHDQTTFVLLGLTSTLIGGWGGLNQTQLRKLLAYSSIAHLGWMVVIVQFSPALTALALATYIAMTSALFLCLKANSTPTLPALATSWAKMPALAALFPLMLLSLGGLPPLTGFLPKWMILQELTKQELPIVAALAAFAALLSLYFYLRLSYAMTLTISPSTTTSIAPWRLYSNQTTTALATSATLSFLLLPISPAILSALNL